MKRRLNVRFLVCLVAATILLGGGIHFLHGYQVSRNAEAFLRQADEFESSGQINQAKDLLGRYLSLRPTDNEARIRYGKLLEDLATSDKNHRARAEAFFVLSEALRQAPENQTLRRQVVRLAMSLGQFDQAREDLILLLKTSPDDGGLEKELARCYASKRQYPEAVAWLRKATAHAPGDVETSAALAELLRREMNQAEQADETMATLLKSNPNSVAAWLEHAGYLMRQARAPGMAHPEPLLAEAGRDVDRAAKLAPRQMEVLLSAADLAHQKGDVAGTRRILASAAEFHPDDSRPYLALSRVEVESGHPADAAAHLRKGLAFLPENLDLLWALADALLDPRCPAAGREEVPGVIARLAAANYPIPPLDYLRARLFAASGKQAAAASLLAACGPQLARGWSHLAKPALLLRAFCHEQLGEIDEAHDLYRQAVTLDSLSIPAYLGLASTLTTLGRYDEALEAYRKILTREPSARLFTARVLVLKNLGLPHAQRRWEEFEQLLAELAREAPHRADVALLRSEMLATLPAGLAQAQKELTAARDAQPNDVRLWIALALTVGRQGKSAEALAILEEATKQAGDRVDLRLARAELETRSGQPGAKERLGRLAEGGDHLTADDRQRLLSGLAAAHIRLGDFVGARQLYRQLVEARPTDRGLRLRLLDLDLQAGDEAAVRDLLDGLRGESGQGGTAWQYARLCYLVWRADHGHRDDLGEAHSLLDTLAAARPGWSRVPVCQGRLAELEGDTRRAIACYQRAVELGEREATMVRRLVLLLYERQRFAEADAVVRALPEGFFPTAEMRRVLTDLALRSDDPARALETAQAAFKGSRDFRDCLAYAQALAAIPARHGEAEPILRRATELAPGEPETWVALIRYLARAGRRPDAEAAFARAERALPAERAALALAKCREALGDREAAERLFQAALSARPTDPAALRASAEFYAALGKPTETQALLRRLIASGGESNPDAVWARRLLAVILASGGNREQVREALGLLGGNAAEDDAARDESVDGRRARAVVLASQSDPRLRAQAIHLLEEILAQRRPMAADQFLLGRLYEAAGEWEKTQVQIQGLLSAADAQPSQLAYFARRLLAHGESAEARHCLERIEKLAPSSAAAIEIRARCLKAEGDRGAAIATLRAYVMAGPSWAGAAGGLLEEMGEFEAAEEMYRRRAAAPGEPEAVLMLAQFLGRRHRTKEALKLCRGAWATCKPEAVAGASVAVLYGGPRDPDLSRDVESKLLAALRDSPKDPRLLVSLAAVRKFQGRYAEAIEDCQRAMQVGTHNPLALNNLAWLLALHGGRSEQALALVEEAIRAVGPAAFLLDTRAVIRLGMGQAGPAVEDLQEALRDRPTASIYFHLARAQVAGGKMSEAVASWQKAKSLGLTPEEIDPLERVAYQELVARLDQK